MSGKTSLILFAQIIGAVNLQKVRLYHTLTTDTIYMYIIDTSSHRFPHDNNK